MDGTDWMESLGLSPHPEGGHFRETYRADETVPRPGLPPRFPGPRPFSTAIYFLLQAGEFSALHRIRSDEVWHFYDGGPLEVLGIDPEGRSFSHVLGRDPSAGQVLQAVVEGGAWFGARPLAGTAYSLVGCTVAPGFDFEDFELARRSDLLAEHPRHRDLIESLARP